MNYLNTMLSSLPFTLPAWMPSWVFLLLLLPVLLWVLAFIIMPFSVFGVKGRIEALEGQIDALHEEMRMAAMRAAGVLPASSKELEGYEEMPNFGRMKKSHRGFSEPALAPPEAERTRAEAAPVTAARERFAPAPSAPPPRPPRRTEPRLD